MSQSELVEWLKMMIRIYEGHAKNTDFSARFRIRCYGVATGMLMALAVLRPLETPTPLGKIMIEGEIIC